MSEDKIERSRQYLRSWRATKRVLQKISTQNNSTELDSLEESETVTEGQWDAGDTLGSTENTMNLSSPMSSEASWPSEETDWEDDLEEVMDTAEKKDGTSDQEDSMASLSLETELASWVSQFEVKNNAVDHLLKILQKHGHTDLPSSARTLLKTPRKITTMQKCGMEYLHYPLRQQLLDKLDKYPVEVILDHDTINLSFNVDGLPLFKSSSKVMWPVLCAVHLKPIIVFPVTLTCGNKKPTDLTFLDDVIADLNDLMSHGLQYKERNFSINVLCIVCDAPAKAFTRGTKLCSGYYGCDKCDQKGEWFNKVTFPATENLTLRTDDSFRSQVQPEHHNANTPLIQLPMDMVKSFPIDYMHQACLGVMKRLLVSWTRGERRVRLSTTQKQVVSSRLLQLRSQIPSIFARTPRGLDDLERWKATEFRQFMLYTGKLVLKGILGHDMYLHFLAFSVAMCILVSPTLVKKHSEYARCLLSYFVSRGRELYGNEFIVYNIHSMLHITDDAVQFNGLDNCSAFKFETYLHTIKKMVRSGTHPLSQIANRIEERCASTIKNNKDRQTKKSKDRAFILDDDNGCEITNDEEKDGHVLCRMYHSPAPLFIEPCHSFLLGVYNFSKKKTTMRWISKKLTEKRAIKIENGDTVTFMAILHQQ